MKRLISLLLFAVAAFAQTNSDLPLQTLKYYTAGGYLEYVCEARSVTQGSTQANTVTVTSISNANPGVVTATAHGFDYPSAATTNPIVKITGATGNWTGINGVWRATITSANAFTIPVDTSAFGTFTGQTITVTSYAPRTTAAVWRVKKYVYDGSNREIFSGWAQTPAGAGSGDLKGGTNTFTNICSNRTSLSYQ